MLKENFFSFKSMETYFPLLEIILLSKNRKVKAMILRRAQASIYAKLRLMQYGSF